MVPRILKNPGLRYLKRPLLKTNHALALKVTSKILKKPELRYLKRPPKFL